MILALDFETANSDPGSICSVGLALLREDGSVERHETLIRPHRRLDYFSYFNIDVHGIRPEAVRNAPEWCDIWPQILPLFKENVVIAHNAAFDIGAFLRVMELYGLSSAEFSYFCSCKAARRLWPEFDNHRLNTLCARLGFEFEHHQAGEDAAAALFLVRRMLRETGAGDWRELLDHLKINPGMISPAGHHPCKVIPKRKNAH